MWHGCHRFATPVLEMQKLLQLGYGVTVFTEGCCVGSLVFSVATLGGEVETSRSGDF